LELNSCSPRVSQDKASTIVDFFQIALSRAEVSPKDERALK
jgi:hypothetical protein